jgi:hypothetical protein
LLFCTGTDIVYSNHGLLSTVRNSGVLVSQVLTPPLRSRIK